MPTLGRLNIPATRDWAEFEDITLTALRIRWSSPSLEKNGRQGQRQAGVDIWGPDDLERPIGVQCKLTEGELELKNLRAEIRKAEKFTPKLSGFYIATTAKTDAKIQAAVRRLSAKRVARGDFAVGIIFWESLLLNLASNPSLMRSHFPHLGIEIAHQPAGARLLAILDIAYLGTCTDRFLKLLFGEFGWAETSPEEEFLQVILAYRSASPLVFDSSMAEEVELSCKKLELAVHKARRSKGKWDSASKLATRLRAIAEGLEYRLSGIEFAVYSAGRQLGAWSFDEAEDRPFSSKARQRLTRTLKLLDDSLLSEVKEQFARYDKDRDSVGTFKIPDRIYQIVRRWLTMRELSVTR